MARSEISDCEISVRLADRQLEFLESKARELGISKEDLVKLYIAEAIDAEHEDDLLSLEGFFKDGPPITKEIVDEVIDEWSRTESL